MGNEVRKRYHEKDKMVVAIIHSIVLFVVSTFRIMVLLPNLYGQDPGLILLCYIIMEYVAYYMQIDDLIPFTLNICIPLWRLDYISFSIQLFAYLICFKFIGWIYHTETLIFLFVLQFVAALKPTWWPLNILTSLVLQNKIKLKTFY